MRLGKFDPRDTAGMEKKEGLARLQALGEEFAELDNLLAFAGQDALLVVLHLHISREEQYERLLEREKDPLSAWKLNPNDWRDPSLWDEITEAYQDALDRCSSAEHYLVPADWKWFCNLAVMECIVLALRPHRARWLDTLARLRKRVLPEIRALRTAAERHGLVRRPRKGD